MSSWRLWDKAVFITLALWITVSNTQPYKSKPNRNPGTQRLLDVDRTDCIPCGRLPITSSVEDISLSLFGLYLISHIS